MGRVLRRWWLFLRQSPPRRSLAIAFRRSAKQRTQASSPASVVQAVVISCVRRPRGAAWIAGVSPASVSRRSPFLLGRRRDACSPGCAVFALPVGSQARRLLSWLAQRSPFLWGRRRGRLRSLRSKAPSAVARLRSVAFGGCQAALRSPLPHTSYLLPLTSYLIPLTSYLLPLTSYLLPLTSYLLPLTFYLLPHTSYLIPLTSYLLPLTSYLLFRFRSRRRRGLRGGRR